MADMNIFQKMSAISQEISTVAKNLEVGYGNNKYKAVGEADVLHAVKPLEAAHGVYSYPYSREIVDSGTMTDSKGNNRLFLRVQTVYRFVNVDKPEEHIDIITFGDGVDSQDKAPGKAMTYGDKYALLKAYKIMTGDDPDQSASEPMGEYREKSGNKRTFANSHTNTPTNSQNTNSGANNVENAADMSKQCTDIELATLESLCTRLGWQVEKVFKNWPNVTKAQYAQAAQELRGRTKDADKRTA